MTREPRYTKTCKTCRETKLVSEFRTGGKVCNVCWKPLKAVYDKQYRSEKSEEERIQDNLKAARYVLAHPERSREIQRRSKLKRMYGITLEQEQAMRSVQGGTCAFRSCDRPASDVDHVVLPSGEKWIRGLLCPQHNRALGMLHSSPIEAEDAAFYLKADMRRRVRAV